jgi:hypothetical protein
VADAVDVEAGAQGCEFQGKRDETLAARTLAFGHEVPGKV